LRELEREFARELVVVGVHSAKFPAEGISRNLRAAVQRLELHHPVVNDNEHHVWDAYAVRAWPTLMFVDPRGRVFARHGGEFALDPLRAALADFVATFDAEGALDGRPLTLDPLPPGGGALRFPGKVLADQASGRLFIADSCHNRVLAADLDGGVTAAFGDGEPGFVDGPATLARFDHPQGLALDTASETLFVADESNHSVRAIDLDTGTVTTVAGTGEQGYDRVGGRLGREVALSSPWDLALVGRRLWIAMAGLHQLWTLDLTTGRAGVAAGTGAESIHDGPLREATFAQPSGLSAGGGRLYVADSESSAVRAVDPAADRVRRLIGRGLFDFGDVDGAASQARLQHPLGVAATPEPAAPLVFVADTYNDKIKRLDPVERQVTTWAGGEAGHEDGNLAAARFWEPSGLSLAGAQLYVADTNNHAIRLIDLNAGTARTLEMRGI
jgi:DNA-binding beta-propeller fold protein YncE